MSRTMSWDEKPIKKGTTEVRKGLGNDGEGKSHPEPGAHLKRSMQKEGHRKIGIPTRFGREQPIHGNSLAVSKHEFIANVGTGSQKDDELLRARKVQLPEQRWNERRRGTR